MSLLEETVLGVAHSGVSTRDCDACCQDPHCVACTNYAANSLGGCLFPHTLAGTVCYKTFFFFNSYLGYFETYKIERSPMYLLPRFSVYKLLANCIYISPSFPTNPHPVPLDYLEENQGIISSC